MKRSSRQDFTKLEKELKPYLKMMGKASDAIIDEGVSNYPVLVVHQQVVELGIPVIRHEEVAGNWSVNASTMEEFVMKKVIEAEKIEDFQSIYKDPVEQLCLFVLSELGAQFVFLKR